MFACVAKIVPSGTISILIYISIPISLFQDVVFFNKQVEAIELSGMALIIIVNVLLGILKVKGILK
jgi:drug/metabolite transporter (DMT)-like permease